MPWTTKDPPPPAKNWDEEAIKKCVPVANAVLEKTGDKTKAIQACIRAAGKTKHPGGKGALFIELPEAMDDEEFCNLIEQADQMGLGFVTLTGEPEQFEIEYEDGRMMALGSVPPDVDFSQVRALYFHDAVLAREETNRNKDCLPPEEIENLAKSIGGMPIDDEHVFESVCGVFTKGKTVTGANGLKACSVDGLVWPQRFPEIAEELVKGERQLSMEVWIAAATCGMCAETFRHKSDYCAHLEHREAQRTLHGVQGFGGALTVKPAGTETTFDHDSMMVVASHHLPDARQDFTIDVMDDADYDELVLSKTLTTQERNALSDKGFALIQTVVNKQTGKKTKVRRFPIHDCTHAANALSRLSGAKDMSSSERASVKRKAQAKLNSKECRAGRKSEGANNMELEERIAQLEKDLETALARATELEADLQTSSTALASANTALETAEAATDALRWSIREQKLIQAGYDAEKLEAEKAHLAPLSDEAFDILVAALAHSDPNPDDPALGSVNLGGGGSDDKVEILWPED